MFETAVFYAFAAILLVAGACVVTARNPVHAAMFLVLAFFTASGIWLLLRAEFLAIALLLVYVGAVMVLFLFVVMMLDINIERLREGFWKNLPLAVVVGGIMMAEMAAVLAGRYFGVAPRPLARAADYSNTKELGRLIYTDYAYAFEIAAAILLVAIVAAIALTLRGRKDSRRQDPAAQVRVRRSERVRLVSMPADKE
ncbi:MAG: NADH:ubiquinone oxidoreductase subunit J [Betaproteobacteria bacterium RIFCSPLOWO2_12_FULL_67_28]|nr:MAG: NADH:ubiquinone oxidoreductase subunit J [Betaproteobacteria bacterium RIFCSPLOWO2_02_FULL_68_150]OGA64713.1 MAG: NADH:ubiquinone oxidoreductase subunit J [Betaproteobacteria bacterium RIFCSPLOWO2_12_FULL_67_28]